MNRIELVGGRDLRRTLKEAGVDVKKMTAANRDAAKIAARGVKTLGGVPVVTGALKRSIRAGATTRAGVVRVGNNRTVRYANPIEWGWPRRNIEPAHFAARGAKKSEPEWTTAYKNAVVKVLDEVKGA